MNLWWLYTRNDLCGYSELSQRNAIPFAWSEIGDINRYVKDKPNWERQFKTFIQVKGDLAYSADASWQTVNRDFDMVPGLFWQFLQIKAGDIIISIETGSQRTMGKPIITGIGKVHSNAFDSYNFNPEFNYAHSVCSDTEWVSLNEWHRNLPIQMPTHNFFILCQDNTFLKQAQDMLIELNSDNLQQFG